MDPVKNVMPSGFIARITFTPEDAVHYTPEGHQVVEILYPEDDDIYEFIEFMQDNEDYVQNATVLFANGTIVDARSISTNAEE